MIRFDGYYIYEPVLYQEREQHQPNYLNMAYLFKNNGVLIYTNKWSTKKESLLFSREDFDKSPDISCYKINNKEIYYINNCEKNGYKFYLDLISDNEIRYRESGKIMRFVPWSKDEK